MKKLVFFIFFMTTINLSSYANILVTIKEGDTLQSISEKHNVSIREIMDLNNIYDAKELKEGETIQIPILKRLPGRYIDYHIVIQGENLSKISRIYGIKVSELIELNRLGDSSILKPGQVLDLPIGARKNLSRVVKTKPSPEQSSKVNYHLISEKESLSKISLIHNIPVETIMSLNNLDSANEIKIGEKLLLKETSAYSSNKLDSYGPIKVDLSKIYFLKDSHITEAKTTKGKRFYIALNCKYRMINNTIKNRAWGDWYFPQKQFEHKLINDICRNISN